jgi:hypothetical protein
VVDDALQVAEEPLLEAPGVCVAAPELERQRGPRDSDGLPLARRCQVSQPPTRSRQTRAYDTSRRRSAAGHRHFLLRPDRSSSATSPASRSHKLLSSAPLTPPACPTRPPPTRRATARRYKAQSRVRHVYFDLAEAIVDRTLERGQLLILASYRTRHLPDLALDTSQKPARISGTDRPGFPERATLRLLPSSSRKGPDSRLPITPSHYSQLAGAA